ncbi:unnamed protein product [Aphanomyces euteiches]|uniref:heme oxygenase (biliverdin-producing) n=2 Tax=Aphanomyces euteiches TaxID=100861 RepID=A0A6G0XU13_9STRA|nr:hypothetical protein Ae201684_001535 [Aphanomyces euteiches]KAH9075134.1 hypothetical protein Ae201684P_003819 [Aphanomyces euteiches]KAH9150786.1 hypothetical protein AeRB84_006440 [Aphanomyces euteiches]
MPYVANGLARDLKEGTQEVHQEAENVHFIREFIQGRITRDVYRVLVAMLYYVYDELEQQMRDAGDASEPTVSLLHFPDELERVPSLAQDLVYFYGSNWREEMPQPSAATKAYVARLRFIGTTQPALLVAHAYTRYLGDLSGGQILKRTAIRAMHLLNGLGTAFYDFKRIKSHKEFKEMYRQKLDELPVTPELSNQLVQEANVAFLLNMAVFEELDVLSGFSTPEAQREGATMRRQLRRKESPSRVSSACPFANLFGQPGVKEMATKYHDLTPEELNQLEIELKAEQEESRRQTHQRLTMSLTALGIAIGFCFALRRLCLA